MSEDTPAPIVHVSSADLARPDHLAGPVSAWLDAKRGRSGSTRTADSYASTLADARAALLVLGLDLDSEPRAVALALQAWAKTSKRGREVKPSTVAQRLAVVSSFYDYAVRRGVVPGLTSNPADLVDRPMVEAYADSKPLDPAAVRKVLGELRQESDSGGPGADRACRDLALLRVALSTGRRVAELAALRWRDAEVTGGSSVTLTFRRAKGGKTMRDALAPSVAADLLNWLHRHYGRALDDLPSDAALWPSLRQGRPSEVMTVRGVAQMIERRLGTNPHALRHSFAHAMRKAGAKDSEVQARLGHSNLATTGRYLAQLDRAENPHAAAVAAIFDGE